MKRDELIKTILELNENFTERTLNILDDKTLKNILTVEKGRLAEESTELVANMMA